MSRAQHITDELTQHFTEVGLSVKIHSRAEWQDQAPLGWAWPAIYDDAPKPEVRICPEILDEQTQHLPTEGALDTYLDVIEWVCDTHITLGSTEPDPAKRQLLIEDELYELYPDALKIWFAMRVAVL